MLVTRLFVPVFGFPPNEVLSTPAISCLIEVSSSELLHYWNCIMSKGDTGRKIELKSGRKIKSELNQFFWISDVQLIYFIAR